MSKESVLLLENVNFSGVELLKSFNHDVTLLKESLDQDKLVKLIEDKKFQALGIRSKTHISKKVLDSNHNLMALGAFCIGTNQIDLEAATSLGVPVFNAPYSNTRSVAELVVSHMISLSRQVGYLSNKAHQGDWQKTAVDSYEVRGKTIGIVGYGHIGTQVGLLSEALGLNVLYYDVESKLPLGNARPKESLEELLSESLFVSLHVPETPETKMLFTKREFSQMKKGSYFINASRGSVVNIEDLSKSLKSEHLKGAAVDVFPKEPRKNGPDFKSELCGLKNVILTPHIGGSTQEAQVSIGTEVSNSLVKYFSWGDTLNAVNFPKLRAFEIKEGTKRLCHIHQNIPGVLAKINTLLSKYELNIGYQKLGTFNDVGYLMTDFEDPTYETLRSLFSEIKGESFTIKARLLG